MRDDDARRDVARRESIPPGRFLIRRVSTPSHVRARSVSFASSTSFLTCDRRAFARVLSRPRRSPNRATSPDVFATVVVVSRTLCRGEQHANAVDEYAEPARVLAVGLHRTREVFGRHAALHPGRRGRGRGRGRGRLSRGRGGDVCPGDGVRTQ